ncbi:MAG: MBOAT family protein, partial [Leptospiraceae bacterium]|nr:MBOAT family protein [Leptospiraceae bacterium]
MIFSSGLFVFFFALVFLVQWYIIGKIRNAELRKRTLHIFLLIVSYIFYMTWDWRFGFLILFSTAVDFVAGLYIQREHDSESEAAQKKARLALIISLGVNLGSLGIFKYFHFFADSFIALFAAIDPSFAARNHDLLFRVILPVGISFFTFQSMSYTIDVYRRIIPAEKSLIRFALFVSFFPQLVAGPIVTAREFLPQLQRFPSVDSSDLRQGCQIFLLGFIKKSVLADHVAPFVDMVHGDPLSYGFFH